MTRRVCLVLAGLAAAGLLVPGPATSQDASAAGGLVGKITDHEGTAARKRLADPRWTPVDARTPVLPGDWLKTGARGANALEVALDGGGRLILGPGALVEVLAPDHLCLHAGEVAVTPAEGKKVRVEAGPTPARGVSEVTERTVLREYERELHVLPEAPRWLVGYEERTPTEAVGALLATVDGRDVPLTLGYHKVEVDIRDQIARTEIEEAFVNHTSDVLEGVFYFPLPADASISGFSMWIGDEQVHGEIVEKQRARAIYETILREKRDPGLLEWAGGSLFKARVYPIGAEKRIKISYTQVLPQTIGPDGAAEVVYHHALASEHLRLHPLKELSVAVTVSSQRRLLGVSVPTHPARVQATDHAARVELYQQEVAPDRDLEVRLRLERPATGMTLASHRRGDDGYFMVLLDAPALARSKTPAPVDLLVLCDTSGSVTGPAREAQAKFVAALLEALGPDDTFDLAVFDTDLKWAHGSPSPSVPVSRMIALDLLERRAPLGWTDLDRAIAAAAERARPNTHVVYVGDGSVTTGDADPAAFARRAASLYEGQGRFHAVVPGSSREAAALKAIAALGGGSVRAVGSDPAKTAFDLLAEVTSPRVRDVKLAFEGLPVAAVYPETLPDLPAGAQHVIVGRWDPTTAPKDGLKGRLRLTGTVEGADRPTGALELTHEVALGDAPSAGADDDASFIPRLWARAHLDHLLAQGASKEVQERVIALSEDFQLMTPYTSFLVLETDADRERFQVKKRTRMRDGEEFFAKGRDQAEHALRRQAALQARAWRRAWRARALETLADMNRSLVERLGVVEGELLVGYAGQQPQGHVFQRAGARTSAMDFYQTKANAAPETEESFSFDTEEEFEAELSEGGADGETDDLAADEPFPAEAPAPAPARQEALAREGFADLEVTASRRWDKVRERNVGISEAKLAFTGDRLYSPWPSNPLDALLPDLPATPGPAPAVAWPKALTDALGPVDLRARVAGAHLRVRASVEAPDARGRLQPQGEALWLLSAERWATASVHRAGEEARVDWLAHAGAGGALQRGALTTTWALGRVRPAAEGDARGWGTPWPFWSLQDLAPYATWALTTNPAADGAVELVFTQPDDATSRVVLIVDPARRVVRSARGEHGDAVTWSLVYDVAETNGAWWPTAARRFQGDRLVEATKITVDVLAQAAFEQALADALSHRSQAVLLGPAPASLRAARKAVREGQPALEDRWAVLGALAAAQRWDAARPHLDLVLAAAKDKPAAVAIEATARQHARRHEELRLLLGRAAAELAKTPRAADAAATLQLLGWSGALSDGAERLELVTRVQPVLERRAGLTDLRWAFELTRVQALEAVGQPDEALALLRGRVAQEPERLDAHLQLAWRLSNHGQADEAVAHLDEALAKHGPWPDGERQALVQQAFQMLWSGRRLEPLVQRFERLEREDPAATAQVLDVYLSALVMLDRPEAAWERVKAWTELGGQLPAPGLPRARFDAAVRHALGTGMYSHTIEPERAAHLAAVVRALAALDPAQHAAALPLVQYVVNDWRWNRTPSGREVVRELFARLRAEAASLPVASAAALFHLLSGAPVSDDPEAWGEVLDAFEARRQALAPDDRAGAAALDHVILSYSDPARRLRRLRHLHAQATGDAVRSARVTLLQAIVEQPWTAELRDEAVELLLGLAPAASDEAARQGELAMQVRSLHQLMDWTTQARAQAEVAARPDHGELDRRRLAAARDEALRAVRAEALELLAPIGAKAPALADWLALERAWLQVKLGRDREQARSACAALIDARLVAAPAFGDAVLLARAVATLLYLVGTDGGAPELADALGARVERALEQKDARLDWREVKLTLLLLRDDLAGMEAALRAWFEADDDQATRWGVPLSHVLAERDRLDEAAALLERLEALDEVAHEDLQRLALLCTALDRPADARAARLRAWSLVDEWQIVSSLQRDASRVSRTGEGVPEALDAETPVKVVALLRKAESPTQHLWTVQRLYETTRDFRLLEGLAEGVLGHSAQRVYDLLASLQQLLDSIQEEATLDRLRAAVEALRARDGTTAVDRRALWLLEALASRGAAAQRQGAGPHLQSATRALREAFALAEQRDGAWAPGEPALYARLLAQQGALAGDLGQEQLRQLQALVALGHDADERLTLAAHLAAAQWSHGRHDGAVRTLSGAIDAARKDGRLAPRHHEHLRRLVGFHVQRGAFVEGEALLERELAAGHPSGPTRALRLALHEVWREALGRRAETRLGRGDALYAAARDALLKDLAERTTEAHASQLVHALTMLWQVAAQQRVSSVGDDARAFAFGELPHVLRAYQHRQAATMVGNVVDALARHAGPVVALDCLVLQAEGEPRWLRLQHADAWSRHGWRFGRLLAEAKGQLSEPLAQRLLELVKRELRRDLLLGRGGAELCWSSRSSHFWREQAEAFAQVAREVLAERREVAVTVVHVARYLRDGLERYDDAIAALADAERRGVLGWDARRELVAWLQERDRHGEALPLAERLVAERPGDLSGRGYLIVARFHTDQAEALARAIADAEAYLRETGAWSEQAAATLAGVCARVERPHDAARLLDEAITLHTRSRPDRGVGGGTLSRYYQQLSEARLQLGDTAGAVDAACGAVVAWGRQVERRRDALENLNHVLSRAPDLDAYVATVDEEAARTGLENPTLRRALGEVYAGMERHADAEVQLRLALEARPDDLEGQRLLVEALDALERPADAAEQLQALAAAAGHDVSLYVELGHRRTKLGQQGEAERAWTNVVELVPHEAEGHTALAQVREEQGRFADAVERWRQVVRVRTDEPAGWLALGRCLLQAGQADEAARVAREVLGREWDARFGHVHGDAQALLDEATR